MVVGRRHRSGLPRRRRRLRLPATAERAIQLCQRPQLVAPGLRQLQFQQEQLLIGDQDLKVRGEAVVVSRSRQFRRIPERLDAGLLFRAFHRELLNCDQRVGHFTVRVEGCRLVLRQRLLESRLRRLVVPLDAMPVEDRLEQSGAERPDDRVALQQVSQVAADRPRKRPSG